MRVPALNLPAPSSASATGVVIAEGAIQQTFAGKPDAWTRAVMRQAVHESLGEITTHVSKQIAARSR